jgi:hypothetical protein
MKTVGGISFKKGQRQRSSSLYVFSWSSTALEVFLKNLSKYADVRAFRKEPALF